MKDFCRTIVVNVVLLNPSSIASIRPIGLVFLYQKRYWKNEGFMTSLFVNVSLLFQKENLCKGYSYLNHTSQYNTKASDKIQKIDPDYNF